MPKRALNEWEAEEEQSRRGSRQLGDRQQHGRILQRLEAAASRAPPAGPKADPPSGLPTCTNVGTNGLLTRVI